ncbi:uncharacterized protein M421DRAFT_63875, partial [Didymella exigua CBS 183.55]
EARACMAVADYKRQEDELKKAEMKDLAADNKLFNETLKEEKRVAAAKAKKVRECERAEERAAINARKEQRRKDKEARNAAKARKVSQRGKCTALKASSVKQKPARRAVGACSHPKPATPRLPRATVTTRSSRTATKYK